MDKKYCLKCGAVLEKDDKTCYQCHADVIEKETKPMIGILIFLIFLSLFLGIPFLLMKSNLGENQLVPAIVLIIVFVLVNFGLYKYRKSIQLEEKPFYNLTVNEGIYTAEKDIVSIQHDESVLNTATVDTLVKVGYCSKCGTSLKDKVKFCSNCGASVMGGTE